MKKHIFIFSQWMNIDGVEASLLGLLKELDYFQVEVDLLLQHRTGPWLDEIPSEVNLLPECPGAHRLGQSLSEARAKRDVFGWLSFQLARYVAGAYYRFVKQCKVDEIGFEQLGWVFKHWMLPKRLSDKHYDLCLVFAGQPGFANHVEADVKAAWVHSDWSTAKPFPGLSTRLFSAVDCVVTVSEKAKEGFDSVVKLKDKTHSLVIENCLSPNWMMRKAEEPVASALPSAELKILSVGRICAAKNFPRALATAKLLKQKGPAFTWFLVGDGEGYDELKQLVAREGLSDCFRLVGRVTNPYPYYRWCDLFVCTSDTEAKSVAVREAQIFAKPVVCTRFPTAASQIDDGIDGILVERTAEGVAEGVRRLVGDPELCAGLAANCRKRDYANRDSIQKILSLRVEK